MYDVMIPGVADPRAAMRPPPSMVNARAWRIAAPIGLGCNVGSHETQLELELIMDYTNIASNPEKHGFRWLIEDVQKQFGPHATDKKVVGQIPIFEPTNIELLIESFGKGTVLRWVTSASSPRVRSQNKHRPVLANGKKPSMDDMKMTIIRLLAGTRAARAPSGQTFTFIGADGVKFTVTAANIEDAETAYLQHLTEQE